MNRYIDPVEKVRDKNLALLSVLARLGAERTDSKEDGLYWVKANGRRAGFMGFRTETAGEVEFYVKGSGKEEGTYIGPELWTDGPPYTQGERDYYLVDTIASILWLYFRAVQRLFPEHRDYIY